MLLCFLTVPDIDCVWSEWSAGTPCSHSCGDGSSIRIRSVTTEQSGNGEECEGNNVDVQTCNLGECSE